MRHLFRQIPKKALSCILALAVILCSVTVMFSAFAETEPEAKDPYTVSYRSPAIPMFVGKVVYLNELEIDFSAANGDTMNGADVIWSHVEGNSAKIMGGYIYASSTGMTKFTASYGGKTQDVWVMVNEENDYDFYLVNLDFTNTTTADLRADWMYAVSHDAAYWPNRYAAPTQKYYRLDNTFVQYSSSLKAMRTGYTYSRGGMLLYNAPILSDFADYTLVTDLKNYGYSGDSNCFTGIAVRVNANFNATTTTLSETTPVADVPVSSKIFNLDDNNTLGTGMYFQHRQYGAVLMGRYNDLAVNANTENAFGYMNVGTEAYPLHSLTGDDWKKTLGYIATEKKAASDLNGDGITDVVRPNINYSPTSDPNYTLNPGAGDGADDWGVGATNDVKHTVTIELNGKDVVYSINGNEILNTQKQMYQVSATNGLATAETKTFYGELDATTGEYLASETVTTPIVTNKEYSRDTYLAKFEKAGVETAGNAIGFTNFQAGLDIYNLKVKLNNVSEATMPNLKDPSFYIVNSASPAIPMFVGKQVAVSDLAVEIDGELVSGADITWAVAQGSSAKVLGDVIYAPETGKTKLTATYGDKVQNVWVIVNTANDYDFYLAYEDWKRDYTSFDANKWMFVTGNDAYKNEFYHTALPENAGATWGFYYPLSASSSHFEFYYAAKMGMIFYQSEILKDFSDYTFSATLLNPTDYSCGTARGFVLRADVNFDAPIDDTTKVFNTSGLYLGQHRHGAVYVGSVGQPLLKGASDSTGAYHGMPRWTFHSLPGDGYLKFVNTKETVADSAAAAITAGEWAGDPNYVMSMHNQGYANAKVVTIKLEGTDILYKIGENTVLDTKAEKVYALNDYYQYSTAVNEEYDWAANTDKIVTNSGTIGFHAKQGMSHIYGFNVKLNDVSAENMPKMSDPTFYIVKDVAPAIPMYAGKFTYLNDIAIEFGNDLVSAKDANLTVKSGSAVLVNGGIYAMGTGLSVLTATYGKTTKNIYVIANSEGENTWYIVNEDLKTTTLPANTWYRSKQNMGNSWTVTNNAALVGSVITSSRADEGLYLNNPWGTQPYTMLYKSDVLKDFSDYTINVVIAKENAEFFSGSELAIVARASLAETLEVEGPLTAPNSTAVMMGVRAFGGMQLHGYSADSSAKIVSPTLGLSMYTLNEDLTTADLIKSGTGNKNFVMAMGAQGDAYAENTDKPRSLSFKLEGNNITYSIDGKLIFDSTKEIKTITYGHSAGAFPASPTAEGTMTSYDYNKYMDGYNLGKGTVGLSWVRSSWDLYSLSVAINTDENNLPKMITPSFFTLSADNPVIPMTAGTKLDLTSFLIEFDGEFIVPSSLAWTFDNASASNIVADADYVYAYERGAYTATVTNGTVTDYVHFVVKNPDETEYVIYEGDYRAENADVSDWKTVVMTGNNVEFTGAYNSQDGKYITGNVASTINLPATSFKPHAFVPYDYFALGAAVGKDGTITTYTTLDNDILADLSDYTVVAGMRMYPNMRGAIGMVGRVSDTVDGLYTPGTSTAVGLAANSPSMYGWSHRYPQKQAFTVKGQSSYSALTNTDVNYYLSASLTEARLWLYRVFEIEFKGDKATYTAPNGATEVISGLAATKGTVAMFAESYDTAAASYVAVPALADIKVVLNDIDISGLGIEKIDHIPDATPQKEVYVDKQNYSFEINPNGYLNGYVKLGDDSYSQKVFLPATIDGKTYKNWSSLIFSYVGSSLKPERDYHGEVILDEGFEKSWGNGFRDNRNLYSITFPKTYTEIAAGDCLGAVALQEVSFPEGSNLKVVGSQGFQNCYSLHSVKLPEGLKTIDSNAFRNCKVLYDINIPSTVQTIGAKAFEAVPFKKVTLPAATTSLGDNAFLNCTYLEKVYVLNATCTIGASAIPATATIYGYTGSTAEEYATANGNEFVPIDDITSNPLPANSAFNLDAVKIKVGDAQVAGADIDWAAHRGSDYELVNGWLMVYAEKDIVLTGTYGDQTVTLNVKVAPKGSDTALEVVTFADKNMTVAPIIGESSKYTVVINENDDVALKYGTLTLTADNGNVTKLTATSDLAGKIFEFEALKPETMVLAAEYTTMAERENSLYPLGVQIRPATSQYSAGLRFVTRFPEIKKEAAGIFLDAEYKQVGAIIIPKVLWTNGKLPTATELANESVSMGDYDAQNVIISKLMSANEAYADAAALLTGIPSNMYGVEIMAIPYIIDKNDKVTYADVNALTRNYNDIYNAAYPKYNDNIDNVLYGGTDHDIDGDPATSAISYGLNEDISFIIRPKGNYQVKWALYKDDADVNAISELGEHEGSIANHVKSGTFTPGVDGNTLIVTTQMKQPGVVRLVYNLYDANGKAVRVNESGGENNLNMSAAADYKHIKQSVEEEELFSAKQVMTEAKGYYEAWKKEWDNQVKVITDAVAADADFAAWLANNEKTAGAEKQVGNYLKLKVAANGGSAGSEYTSYFFWIATGEEGISTAGTENNRPATGVFSVPNVADNSLDLYATFTAWGGNNAAVSGPQSGKLEVRVVGHGKDLGTAFDLNSGNNTEDPTQVFNYGILNRDYVALQVAKTLFDDKLKDNLSIKTNGGSMGGWRSVIIGAIDTDVNEFQVNIPWMCQVGAAVAGDIASWHPTYCDGLRPFSTVTAARIINERVAAGEFTVTITAGLGDYQASAPHGIIALYNAFDDAKVAKSLTFWQFKEHGNQVYGNFTEFTSTVTNR